MTALWQTTMAAAAASTWTTSREGWGSLSHWCFWIYYRVTRFSLSPFFGSVQFHCCGVHNYTDWKDTKYFSTQGIPATCCKDPMNCKPETLKNLQQAADEVYQTVSVDRRHFLSFTIWDRNSASSTYVVSRSRRHLILDFFLKHFVKTFLSPEGHDRK